MAGFAPPPHHHHQALRFGLNRGLFLSLVSAAAFKVITMDECRKRLRKVGRKGVKGSSSDFYFASLDGNLVLDAGERKSTQNFTQ